MKISHYKSRILLLFCLIVLFISGCMEKLEEGVAVRFESEIYDFGIVDEGDLIEYSFKFKNIGMELLKIQDVRPSCGCTVTDDWDKEVESGKSGKIPITVKSEGFQGKISKTITITTNIPDKETIILKVEGEVNTPIQIKPRSAWLGEVNNKTKALDGTFELISNLSKPLKITSIDTRDNVVAELVEIEAGKEYKIEFSINPPFTGAEHIRESMTVNTGNSERPTIDLEYSYFIPPELHIYPRKIMVASDQTDREFERRITVKSRLEDPVSIINLRVVGSDQVETEILEPEAGTFFQIVVKMSKGFIFPDDNQLYVEFQVSNDPKKEVYKIDFEEYER